MYSERTQLQRYWGFIRDITVYYNFLCSHGDEFEGIDDIWNHYEGLRIDFVKFLETEMQITDVEFLKEHAQHAPVLRIGCKKGWFSLDASSPPGWVSKDLLPLNL